MAAETKIIIHAYSVNAQTGGITLALRSVTSDGNTTWEGPVAEYHCDPKMLELRHGGSIEAFEAWAAKEHAPFAGSHPELATKLAERKGKVIG